MRTAKRSGNFFLCLLLNMMFNIEGIIPAAGLLLMHFWLDISLWWTAGAVAVWIIYLILWMFFIGWAGKCGAEKDAPKENKNPYS